MFKSPNIALAVVTLLLAALTLLAAGPMTAPGPQLVPFAPLAMFPLRTDPPPKDWKTTAINEALPYWWEPGTVYVLAWEVIEDDQPWRYTQVLVLKHFDRSPDAGGRQWVLAQVFHRPKNVDQPWQRERRRPMLTVDVPTPKLPDAWLFGCEFYFTPPMDEQLMQFLRDTMWDPHVGELGMFFIDDGFKCRMTINKLVAGGVNRNLWHNVFGREVGEALFPELRKATKTARPSRNSP